jgi:hypothetical protein
MTIAQQPIHTASANGAQTTLSVLNPMGYPPKVTGKALAPRLDSLEAKTVFLVDCRFDDSARLLEQVQAWFTQYMPGVTTQMVSLANVYGKDDPQLWARIKQEGHAAIVGVGH